MPVHCPAPLPGLLGRPRGAAAGRRGRAAIVYLGQGAAVLASRSGGLVPVTSGGLAPGGLDLPDRDTARRVLAGWSAPAEGPAAVLDLRRWWAAATPAGLRIPMAAPRRPAAWLAELDRRLPARPPVASPAGPQAAELARLALTGAGGELPARRSVTVGATGSAAAVRAGAAHPAPATPAVPVAAGAR